MTLLIKYGPRYPSEDERVRARRLREAEETGRQIREEIERTTAKCIGCGGNGRPLVACALKACPDCQGTGRVARCQLVCPHGDRCTQPAKHDGGHNFQKCVCNEPLIDMDDSEYICPPQWIKEK